MRKTLIYLFSFITLFSNLHGQEGLKTVAERSDFKSTSASEDVYSFINQLKNHSKLIRIESIATSSEGRDLPLMIIGDPLPKSPADLKDDSRLVVYIQANIHAGEVEGKEAVLMYARDLLSEKHPAILRDLVILICPVFNPDGNDRIDVANRTYQNGPVNGVGVRHNGQMLDLNRDAVKAESPEIQGLISNVFKRWDPYVFMDCHTTDGSYHVEPVTFTWMVNPNGDKSLISYMRDKMVPEMSSVLRSEYKTENCYYGEFIDMANPSKGWIFDAAEPRYVTNYAGLRNRLAILDENYVYSDFKSRVWGCYYLIHSLNRYAASHKDEISKLVKAADERAVRRGENTVTADSFAIDYKPSALAEPATIQTYEADVITNANGRRSYKRSDRQVTVSVPYLIDYRPVKNVKFPWAYLITVSDPAIINKLLLHGIRVERMTEKQKIDALRFEISNLRGGPRLNQGHYMNTVSGKYMPVSGDFPAGTLIVRMSQPLSALAAELLEPESKDGLLTWNFLDRYLVPQWGAGFNPSPVYKIIEAVDIKSEIIR